MASACVNNIGMSSEKFLDCTAVKCPSYGWMSPRVSFTCEVSDEEASTKLSAADSSHVGADKPQEDSDPETSGKDFIDFEFRLEDPVNMLPADELFSDGKLVPLHLSTIRKSVTPRSESPDAVSEETSRSSRRNEISSSDPYLFSPKAPSCSSHWKELLGLKKLYQNSNGKQDQDQYKSAMLPLSSSSSDIHNNRKSSRSVRQLLLRNSKSGLNSTVDSSLCLPLLKEPDNNNNNESLLISSRLSLSSSSPGHDYDDLPRHSLDSDHKPTAPSRNARQITKNPPRVRAVKHKAPLLSPETPTSSARSGRSPGRKTPESTVPVRDVSADSPRMISSGKILFHSLERSSSSPSSFNGGPRYKHRGMERSNSAHVVRVSPVLNVPVCTIRGASSKSGHVFGFPLFSSAQNKNQQQHRTGKNRTDRT